MRQKLVSKHMTQSSLDISNTDISKYPLISKNIVWTQFLFQFALQPFYLIILISQSKFSGTKKFDFDISVVPELLIYQSQIFWSQKIYFEVLRVECISECT